MTESSCICPECFLNGDHEGHDYKIYHSGMGGSCDCGDPLAWRESGNCTRHGAGAEEDSPPVPEAVIQRMRQVSKVLVRRAVAGTWVDPPNAIMEFECIAHLADFIQPLRQILAEELCQCDEGFIFPESLGGAWWLLSDVHVPEYLGIDDAMTHLEEAGIFPPPGTLPAIDLLFARLKHLSSAEIEACALFTTKLHLCDTFQQVSDLSLLLRLPELSIHASRDLHLFLSRVATNILARGPDIVTLMRNEPPPAASPVHWNALVLAGHERHMFRALEFLLQYCQNGDSQIISAALELAHRIQMLLEHKEVCIFVLERDHLAQSLATCFGIVRPLGALRRNAPPPYYDPPYEDYARLEVCLLHVADSVTDLPPHQIAKILTEAFRMALAAAPVEQAIPFHLCHHRFLTRLLMSAAQGSDRSIQWSQGSEPAPAEWRAVARDVLETVGAMSEISAGLWRASGEAVTIASQCYYEFVLCSVWTSYVLDCWLIAWCARKIPIESFVGDILEAFNITRLIDSVLRSSLSDRPQWLARGALVEELLRLFLNILEPISCLGSQGNDQQLLREVVICRLAVQPRSFSALSEIVFESDQELQMILRDVATFNRSTSLHTLKESAWDEFREYSPLLSRARRQRAISEHAKICRWSTRPVPCEIPDLILVPSLLGLLLAVLTCPPSSLAVRWCLMLLEIGTRGCSRVSEVFAYRGCRPANENLGAMVRQFLASPQCDDPDTMLVCQELLRRDPTTLGMAPAAPSPDSNKAADQKRALAKQRQQELLREMEQQQQAAQRALGQLEMSDSDSEPSEEASDNGGGEQEPLQVCVFCHSAVGGDSSGGVMLATVAPFTPCEVPTGICVHMCGHATHHLCLSRFLRHQYQPKANFPCPHCRRNSNAALDISEAPAPSHVEAPESLQQWITSLRNSLTVQPQPTKQATLRANTLSRPISDILSVANCPHGDAASLYCGSADVVLGTLCHGEASLRLKPRQTHATDATRTAIRLTYRSAVNSIDADEARVEFVHTMRMLVHLGGSKDGLSDPGTAKPCSRWNVCTGECDWSEGFACNTTMALVIILLHTRPPSLTHMQHYIRFLYLITVCQAFALHLICREAAAHANSQIENGPWVAWIGSSSVTTVQSAALTLLRRIACFAASMWGVQSHQDDYATLCQLFEVPLVTAEDLIDCSTLATKLSEFESSTPAWGLLAQRWCSIAQEVAAQQNVVCVPNLAQILTCCLFGFIGGNGFKCLTRRWYLRWFDWTLTSDTGPRGTRSQSFGNLKTGYPRRNKETHTTKKPSQLEKEQSDSIGSTDAYSCCSTLCTFEIDGSPRVR
eukprot:c19291_g1_i2.p1 GENE.c19291_g1_i2~~c19291_g1_i2.p1  ORF type:complete len:1392 (+),score=257.16 c19291_g1_i2:214-4176(+)